MNRLRTVTVTRMKEKEDLAVSPYYIINRLIFFDGLANNNESSDQTGQRGEIGEEIDVINRKE